MLNYLDLFSGIGGFALGAYWSGFRCENHYFSEIEKYPSELYKLRFPDAIALGDIAKINGKDLPHGEWIITGGFPCQDISTAGKGAGLDGSRSGLWFEYARLISELRPRYAIMENVGALVGRGLDRVLGSLTEIGYDAEWIDIRASDNITPEGGAPHRRERIWIVAYPSGEQNHAKRGIGELGRDTVGRPKEATLKENREARDNGIGRRGEDVAYPHLQHGKRRSEPQFASSKGGSSRHQPGGSSEDVADSWSVRLKNKSDEVVGGAKEANREADFIGSRGHIPENIPNPNGTRLQKRNLSTVSDKSERVAVCNHAGWRDGRAMPQPAVRRVVDGVSTKVGRLKGLGNAIVPQIAQMIFEAIMESEKEST